jgi:hypothetical protein
MDLGNAGNWSLAGSGVRRRRLFQNHFGNYFYVRIPEERIETISPVVKVSLRSESAPPHWFLGARIGFYAYSHTGFSLFPHPRNECKINDDTTFIFEQPTEQVPFSISLRFPRYLDDVSFEVWQYVDDSGRYPSSVILQELSEAIEGQQVILKNVLWTPIEDTDLIVSTFTEEIKYTRYSVGRFTVIFSGEIISEPLITISPRQLIARFTSTERILPNTICVQVNPIS